MSSATQYYVHDWLCLHDWTLDEVLHYCDVIRSTYGGDQRPARSDNTLKQVTFDLDQSLEDFILPALSWLFGCSESHFCDFSLIRIIRHSRGELDVPFTEWCDRNNAPVVHLVWAGSADDLICLAHEISHATQMILSKHVFMVPVAREVCAFLGELALIKFAVERGDDLHQQLCKIWRHENRRYLGSDVARLSKDLQVISSPYIYRHNYPLARIAAMSLFDRRDCYNLLDFFASGSTAMGRMNFPEMMNELPGCRVRKGNIMKVDVKPIGSSAARADYLSDHLHICDVKVNYSWSEYCEVANE
jgi:hypothetical protein